MRIKNLKMCLYSVLLSIVFTSCSSYHDMLYQDAERAIMEDRAGQRSDYTRVPNNNIVIKKNYAN